ncbi:MAG: zinc ribbon domain-containing protein [Bacteroides sp.]|nr:zinc ribbon domain-containing protein [Bacillota bacterium]MCM1394049.1 zinc ribbon domain-containing protein [[Eubacterium] siraeum]MCM1455501.1 zinc ribbon domain-containing protein [Bacteroides sp.]
MPKLICHCRHEFEVSRDDEIVECPECGRGYKNPFYIAPVAEQAAETQISPTASKQNMSLKGQANSPLGVVSALSKSWLMLAIAITVTVTAVFAIINLIPHLKGFLMYVNIIKILLYVVLCVGVWQIFINGRTNKRSSAGFKSVKVYVSVIYSFIMLIAVLILILVVVVFGAASEIAGEMPVGDTNLNTILILVIFAAIAVIAVMSTFFSSINGVLKSAQNVMQNLPVTRSQSYLAAIILIVIGLIKLVIMCATNVVAGIFSEAISQIGALEGPAIVITKLFGNVSLESNWSSILVSICEMLNYILGGVLLIIYSKKMSTFNSLTIPQNV